MVNSVKTYKEVVKYEDVKVSVSAGEEFMWTLRGRIL